MKKFLLLALFVTLDIFATDMLTLNKLYEDRQYLEVIKKSKLSYENYNKPKFHLLWAESAEALGDDISAMSAYERVLILEPKNTKAQIALVGLYKKLNRESLSKELRETLIHQDLSASNRAALGVIYDDFTQKLNLVAKLSLGYDSNIGANSDLELNSNETDKSIDTLFSKVDLQLNFVKYISHDWFLQIDAIFQAQNNFDASFYNLYDALGGAGIGYKSDNFTLFIPVSYSRMYYFERSFLSQYATTPYLNFTLSKDIILNLNLKYIQRRFIDSLDKNRDDDILGTGLGVFYYFSDGFLYAKATYDTYTAQNRPALYFTDKKRLSSDIGISMIFDKYIFGADYHFGYSDFDDTFISDSSIQEDRTDTYNRIGLKGGYLFYNHWALNLEYIYTNNDSTYRYATYDKQVIMTSLQYSY
jgi:hypothetical protein